MSSERLLVGQGTVRLRLSKRKKRFVRMLHTENLKLKENLQKNIFPKVSSRTRMYNQLIK
jgi:hypothetical protein